jgi:hypothetical protein
MQSIRFLVDSWLALVIYVVALAVAPGAAQQISGAPGSADATMSIDGKQLPPPPLPFGGVINDSPDGQGIAGKKIPHTIPLPMSIDETFDVGSDTRTAVNDDYKLPFRFTGTIDKLTFNLGPEQLTDADKKAIAEKMARARD